MPKLNGMGPDGVGSKTGRVLGLCQKISNEEALERLGKGMGKRRRSGGGKGSGKRLKSGI